MFSFQMLHDVQSVTREAVVLGVDEFESFRRRTPKFRPKHLVLHGFLFNVEVLHDGRRDESFRATLCDNFGSSGICVGFCRSDSEEYLVSLFLVKGVVLLCMTYAVVTAL